MTRSSTARETDRRHYGTSEYIGNDPKVKSSSYNKMASKTDNNRPACEDDDFDDDETLGERLLALAEMFPDTLRWACSSAARGTCTATKTGWWLLRNALWIASSSAVILALPVIFESERAQQQEEQLQQQRQILLGPNAAVSGAAGNNLLPGMGMMPPPPQQASRKS